MIKVLSVLCDAMVKEISNNSAIAHLGVNLIRKSEMRSLLSVKQRKNKILKKNATKRLLGKMLDCIFATSFRLYRLDWDTHQ